VSFRECTTSSYPLNLEPPGISSGAIIRSSCIFRDLVSLLFSAPGRVSLPPLLILILARLLVQPAGLEPRPLLLPLQLTLARSY